MQLGRPVTTSVTKGVGNRHNAALVSIESVLTASTARCRVRVRVRVRVSGQGQWSGSWSGSGSGKGQ
eukprot:scaffold70388_cov63-Phaeocystis_antarctica.AAC.1